MPVIYITGKRNSARFSHQQNFFRLSKIPQFTAAFFARSGAVCGNARILANLAATEFFYPLAPRERSEGQGEGFL
jgi:hypothetical protein